VKSSMQQVVVGLPVPPPSTPGYPSDGYGPPPAKPTMVDPNTLKELGWPPGLTTLVANQVASMPLRFVIVDNSGSMQHMDGTRYVSAPGGMLKAINATRWQELGQAVTELAEIAIAVRAPTHFHLLNPSSAGQFFAIGDEFAPPGGFVASLNAPRSDLAMLKAAVATSPSSTTPLTEALQRVDAAIRPSADALRASGQKAVIIISTDGLPNHPKSFLTALQHLQQLPVWVVVRLCTSEDDVVDYWSDLDAQLEVPLETLDDLKSEAGEVAAKNAWLTYGPPLHAARMFGLQDKLFDMLDERTLLPSQLKEMAERILGCAPLPEPEADPKGFSTALKAALAQVRPVYNPLKNKATPWIDTSAASKIVNKGGCTIS